MSEEERYEHSFALPPGLFESLDRMSQTISAALEMATSPHIEAMDRINEIGARALEAHSSYMSNALPNEAMRERISQIASLTKSFDHFFAFQEALLARALASRVDPILDGALRGISDRIEATLTGVGTITASVELNRAKPVRNPKMSIEIIGLYLAIQDALSRLLAADELTIELAAHLYAISVTILIVLTFGNTDD